MLRLQVSGSLPNQCHINFPTSLPGISLSLSNIIPVLTPHLYQEHELPRCSSPNKSPENSQEARLAMCLCLRLPFKVGVQRSLATPFCGKHRGNSRHAKESKVRHKDPPPVLSCHTLESQPCFFLFPRIGRARLAAQDLRTNLTYRWDRMISSHRQNSSPHCLLPLA